MERRDRIRWLATRIGVSRRSFGVAAAALLLAATVSTGRAESILGLTVNDTILSFDSAKPGPVTTPVPVTGLQPGEHLLAIDLRPATGQLYALGSTSRLYTIERATGAATPVGSPGAFTLVGTAFGFDFDPVADQIRVVSDADQNLRLDPNDGTLLQTGGTLAFAAADPHFGANPDVIGAAYTNSVAGAATTTLYAIDATLQVLVRLDAPDTGMLDTVGSLGLGFLLTDDLGFDISGETGTAYALLTGTGGNGLSQLSVVHLAGGDSGGIGGIGGGATLIDIAVPEPAGAALAAATALACLRWRRRG